MEDSNNNTNLKSQLDTIKHDFHKFLKQSAQDAKETLTSFLKKTERKVDAILAQVDMSHELYKGLILIKAYCVLRILLALLMTDSQKFVRTAEPLLIECETVLKPYKNRAEGVWLYVMSQTFYADLIKRRNKDKPVLSPEFQNEYRKGLKLIGDADKIYLDYVHYNMDKPWGTDEIFFCYDSEGNQLKTGLVDELCRFRDRSMTIPLLEFASNINDQLKVRKYGINGLRSLMESSLVDPRQTHNKVHRLVRMAAGVVHAFTNDHCYVQA